ncbi:MAG: exodeoxyribonuclease V subunit gamma [Chitinophagaceae bacterium]|nr:exodeoxyribonuclease V subunit gamma [Chitinophagaceae bacterium]MCZ2397457.1 exodeoxyribonuclease V subunit gamma [Chitinophagales bacterium]
MPETKLYIKGSNSLTKLAEEFCRDIGNQEMSVFQPLYIITQTEGMNSWLKTQTAERAGIAANISFLKPNDLINKIYYLLGGQYQKTLSRLDIQWLIYDTLDNEGFMRHFPHVASYYHKDGLIDNIKRIALARQVADLFDQYQVYRYDMLEKWNHEEQTTRDPEERWQLTLWNIIRNKAGVQFPDKATIRHSIIDNLNRKDALVNLAEAMPAIYLFGTSLITGYHHEILLGVSQHIPIYVYLPNPAPGIYWYEDQGRKSLFYQRKKKQEPDTAAQGNSLLTDWGKLTQNTFRLFFKDDSTINNYEDFEEVVEANTLLGAIRSTIHRHETPEKNYFKREMLNDHSVTIHSCFSPLREVEALYNFIVRLLDENPQKYSLRDIIVQVTDINKYASYIRAVFDNAPFRLRYEIADESLIASDSISQALYSILTIEQGDFTSEKVLQLLDYSTIRDHFRIYDSGLIRRVVSAANIRHGIKGDQADDTVYVSWDYGLKRIMYGICMSDETEIGTGDSSFFTVDLVESSAAGEVVHFVSFIEKLIHSIQERDTLRTVTEWIQYVYEVLDNLLADRETETDNEYHLINNQLQEMISSGNLFEEKISYAVFLRQFLPTLEESARSANFGRGGITFCSLIPMRSIPFKVVAMLGIDADKFPRKPVKTGFNLMENHPLPGDRNVKINDKHLFLETLLSAEEKLFISYIGQRIKDNTTKPPSILIDELISFIESASKVDDVRDILVTKQPLHGFSSKYGHDDRYYTYLPGSDSKKEIGEEAQKEETDNNTITIESLYRFFSDTVAYFYNHVLGIYFDEHAVTLPETEIFEMDALEKWKVNRELLYSDQDELNTFIRTSVKTGLIPLRTGGEYAVHRIRSEYEDTISKFTQERNGLEPEKKNLVFTTHGITVSGTIENVFGDKVLIPNLSKNPGKAQLKALLYALLAQATGSGLTVCLIHDGRSHAACQLQADATTEILMQLVEIFKSGCNDILLFNIYWMKDKGELSKKIEFTSENNPYYPLAMRDRLSGKDTTQLFNQYIEIEKLLKEKINLIFNA